MKKQLIKWHKGLVWFGLVAIVCWAISGISHPLMAWFGPQASKMFPPRLVVDSRYAVAIDTIIRRHGLSQAAIAKVVPTANGAMLQLTDASTDEPRRYFSLSNGDEIKHYDAQQAKWLAAYYTGIDIAHVESVQFINNFSHNYPRVNRLLPVYKVNNNSDGDELSAYVYTETNALAALNNTSKRRLQYVFQTLHTWSWLDITGQGRVVLMALLLITLFTMALTGVLLVFSLRRRNTQHTSRRWHRSLAYVLWLPLLAWSASGFYHLLQSHYIEPVSGIRLGKGVDLHQWSQKSVPGSEWLSNVQSHISHNRALNAVTLVNSSGNNYYRLSLAPTKSNDVTRNARFDGQAIEQGVIYIDSRSGLPDGHNDRDQAIALLKQFKGPNVKYDQIERVTRFGANYDFRNKRLPVWQIGLIDEASTHLFIDPITGILVDQNRRVDRYESLSFSILHKWNLLAPFVGRQWRDILIVITLVACLLMSVFGLMLHLNRRRASKTLQ